MPGIGDIHRGKLIKALVYGKFKTGKTAGAATFPRPNFLDFDNGIATLTNPELEAKYKYSQHGIMFESFSERDVDKWGVVKTHNAFDDACRYFDACMSPKPVKYVSPKNGQTYELGSEMFDTWVIDSGTTLSQVAKNKALILLGGKLTGKSLSNTLAQAQASGLIVPKKQDFGAERSMVEQFIDMVLNTDKNVLLLAHEKEEWEGEGEAAHVVGRVPMFTGQSAENIPLKFDEVYSLLIKMEGPVKKRILQTVPGEHRSCGSRLGLPDGTVYEYDAIRKALNL